MSASSLPINLPFSRSSFSFVDGVHTNIARSELDGAPPRS